MTDVELLFVVIRPFRLHFPPTFHSVAGSWAVQRRVLRSAKTVPKIGYLSSWGTKVFLKWPFGGPGPALGPPEGHLSTTLVPHELRHPILSTLFCAMEPQNRSPGLLLVDLCSVFRAGAVGHVPGPNFGGKPVKLTLFLGKTVKKRGRTVNKLFFSVP